MDTPILNVEHLKKRFGKTEILHDINFTVSKGDVYGLIGQNGAGKTTLLRLAAGVDEAIGRQRRYSHRKTIHRLYAAKLPV